MKKGLLIVGGLALVLIAVIAGGFIWLEKDMDTVIESDVETVDLALVEDGVYEGTYEEGRFTTTLLVTVEDHTITDVKVVDDVLFKDEGKFEELKEEVLSVGTPDVDVLAGATATSTAYLIAMSNALSGGASE